MPRTKSNKRGCTGRRPGRPFVSTDMKFRIVEALCTDCRILLSRFEQHNTLRFASFCEVWKETNFSLIYYAKPDAKGRRQLVEYLMRIFCGYIGASCPPQYRVGAVYGLYALYNTQIHQPKSKIRVTMTLWKELQELHQEMIEQQHHDVDYIIRSLKDACAFHFVAMPIQLACGSREAIPENERELGSAKNQSDILQTLEPFHDMVTSLHNVDEEYKKLKESLSGCSEVKKLTDQRSLHVISTDFIPAIESEIQEYEEWKSNYQAESALSCGQASAVDIETLGLVRPSLSASQGAPLTSEEDLSASVSVSGQPAAPENRAELIANIKKNAFASVGKGSVRDNQPRIPKTAETSKTRKRASRVQPLGPKRYVRKKIKTLRRQLKEAADGEKGSETG